MIQSPAFGHLKGNFTKSASNSMPVLALFFPHVESSRFY